MSYRLILSRNSVRNCTIDCDAHGIHYEVSTPLEGFKTTRITTIKRWDAGTGQSIVVCEWKRKKFMWKGDGIRFAKSQMFVPINNFLQQASWLLGDQSFVGEGGRRYTWKPRVFSMKLYAEGAKSGAIATFVSNRSIRRQKKAYLELQPQTKGFLDRLIVAFLITEKQRRDREDS